jgi:hypothetical protein
MTPRTIQRLDRLFASSPVLVGGAVAAGDVDRAEQRIGVRFASDYREFITRYGSAVIGSLPVLGLRQAVVMGDDLFSVTDVTARFRADGWTPTDQWVVISVDLAGNPIGLTSDGSIWLSDHDAGTTTMLATTFEDFIVQLLDQAND